MKRLALLLAVLWALLSPVVKGAPVLAGVDLEGKALKYGSGWDGISTYITPVVCDDGRVLFVAPMPGEASSATDVLRGTYVVSCRDLVPKAKEVFEGYAKFAYETFGGTKVSWAMTNFSLASDKSRGSFYVLWNELNGPVRTLASFTAGSSVSKSANLTSSVSTFATLQISGDGSLIGISDPNGENRFYSVDDESFTWILKESVPVKSGDGHGYALGIDGSGIVFASRDALDGNESETLRIYRYEVESKEVASIVDVEDVSETKHTLSQGCALSSAQGSEAFVFLTNNAELLGIESVELIGLQVVMATRGSDGEYTFMWCNGEMQVMDCGSPSLSADGRFVVFTGRVLEGIRQVYRYDRRRDVLEVVSALNGALADAACYAPALSPNGRMVAFASAATNLGYANESKNCNVWFVDMGVSPCDTTLDLESTDSATELPLETGGTLDDTAIAITWEGELPGRLYYISGEGGVETEVVSGVSFKAVNLPVYFKTDGSNRVITLTVTLTEGEKKSSMECVITVREPGQATLGHVSCKTDGTLHTYGGFPLSGGSFSQSCDGRKVAFTSVVSLADEDDDNVMDIYVRDTRDGVTTLLTGGEPDAVSSVSISGDGERLFYVCGGTLWSIPSGGGMATEVARNVTGSVAPSYDGGKLALISAGKPCLLEVGDEKLTVLSEESGFTSPMLSLDGGVAAFLKASGELYDMYVWEAVGGMQLWKKGVKLASLTASGGYALVLKDGKLLRLASDGSSAELTLPEGVTADVLWSPLLSANGRYLCYGRLEDGVRQAYRLDIVTGSEVMASRCDDGTAANAGVSMLSISGDGQCVCFVTTASNLVSGKTVSYTEELYQAVFPEEKNTAPAAPETLVGTEDDDGLYIAFPCTDAEGDDTVLSILSQPSEGTCELLAPNGERASYTLCFSPPRPNFCGTVTFTVGITDCNATTTSTVTLTVEDVNDAPYWLDGAVVSYTVYEGASVTGESLKSYADDPDLANPAPWTDSLSFSLKEGAPDWVSLDENSALVLAPGYDISRRDVNDGSSDIEVTCVVSDASGVTVELPVTVTVVNVNRAPQLTAPRRVREGVAVAWSEFTLRDDDPEDGGLLRIRLGTPSKGVWTDRSGAAVGTRLLGEADFPIMYTSKEGAVNSDSCVAYAVDGGAAESTSVSMTLLLKEVSVSSAELWGELATVVSGWALLSVPFTVETSQLVALFGSELWVWSGGAYAPAGETVAAGTGFMVHLQAAPKTVTVTGTRGDAPLEGTGWNLLGPLQDCGDDFATDGRPLWRLRERTLVRTGDIVFGVGYWRFVE